jgi:Protein of unknown function (DUF1302)
MKKRGVLLLLILLWITGGISEVVAKPTTINGYVRNHTGILLEDDHDYAIIQDTFDLRLEHTRGKVAFMANPYINFYHNKDRELDLRQSYIDIYLDAIDFRIGKQQIVWGKADGVFITDVVSPKDMSDFLLPDFEEIRLGVQALKVDTYIGDNTVEFVWIPDFTPTQSPDEDSIWFVQPEFSIDPTYDYSKKEVPSNFNNSEAFLKLSAITSVIDYELMAGYMWDDDPTIHVARSIDSSTGLPAVVVTPEHHRLTMGGGSFSTTLGGVVVRGEGAYYTGKYFRSEDPDLDDGVTVKDYIHYLVGLNYTIGDIKMSVQFIEQQIQNYDNWIINDETDDKMTLLLSTDFLRETLKLELFSYFDLNNNGSLVRPKISYDLIDGFQVLAGFNVFNGDIGMYGQYDDNDMVYTKIKYSF